VYFFFWLQIRRDFRVRLKENTRRLTLLTFTFVITTAPAWSDGMFKVTEIDGAIDPLSRYCRTGL
jgi:hypothetical protein